MYRHIDPTAPPAAGPDDAGAPVTCLISDLKRFVEERKADEGRKGKGGPNTPEGKRISSLNALRSGIHGQITSLPAEDLAEFNRIVAAIRKELDPRTERENLLSSAIAESEFRLARVRAIENSLFAQGYRKHILDIDSGHPEVDSALCAAETWAEQHKQFMNLQLYETRLSNLVRRQTEQLNQLQAARKAACKQAEDDALLLLRHAQSKGETYEPGDDFQPAAAYGEFVFSAESLLRRYDRECRLDAARSWNAACDIRRKRGPEDPKFDRAA